MPRRGHKDESFSKDKDTKEIRVYGNIGNLKEFNMEGDWNIYKERLQQYFLANDLKESKKVIPVPLTLKNFLIYAILTFLKKNYDELVALLDKHNASQEAIYRKRIDFYIIDNRMVYQN